MEQNQRQRRIARQTALNKPPIKVTPEGGYHRDYKVTAVSGLSDYKSMQAKNQIRKEQADQKVKAIVEAWEAQPNLPLSQRVKGKFAFGCALSEFSKTIGLGLSYTSLEKRHKMWSHLHD